MWSEYAKRIHSSTTDSNTFSNYHKVNVAFISSMWNEVATGMQTRRVGTHKIVVRVAPRRKHCTLHKYPHQHITIARVWCCSQIRERCPSEVELLHPTESGLPRKMSVQLILRHNNCWHMNTRHMREHRQFSHCQKQPPWHTSLVSL